MTTVTESRILANPYIQGLQDGRLGLAEFRRSQEQFYFAVAFYPRPMAALAARLTEPEDRVGLIQNLVEEHGDFDPRAFHQATFARFLGLLGGKPPAAAEAPVSAFNSALWGVCTNEEPEVGLGCLGAIESEFADASEAIGAAAVARGWVDRGRLVHYSLHAAIDKRHARELLAPLARRDPARQALGRRGTDLGAFLLDRLYRDLAAPGAVYARGRCWAKGL